MAATSVCKACEEPLVVQVEDEDGDNAGPQTVPDDLELTCNCHFHWQCLLDQSSEVAISLKCPSCDTALAQNNGGPSVTNSFLQATPSVSIMTRYTNEGGYQEGLDILPAITEEAYLEANPEARPARALHVMCSEGDVDGIVDLLRDIEQEESGASPAQLIRYQDPLGGNKSGLHLALEQGREEVVWLLLWLGSPLRTDAFPEPLRQIAQAMNLQRPATPLSDDIRALKDERGRSAEATAEEHEGVWAALLQANVLHPGSS
ncbi:hypothetical protein F4808DRAFT_454669 [Astrocystis sublimbata]|nr:hypothetical protein F4808DRAFT_454669 [Astrocystis sublimbata]